jgi:hypothetical protein
MPASPRSFPELPPKFPALPAWARPGRAGEDPAFLAGAALAAIDPIARSAHPLSTLWRRRLALKAAENLAKLQGRPESAADIRDHFFLVRDGGDPGPAGRILEAVRALCDARALDPERWRTHLPELLQIRADDAFHERLEAALAVAENDLNPIAAAAAVAAGCLQTFPETNPLALWLADAVLARRLRWPAPVPLLAAHLSRRDLRLTGSRTGVGSRPAAGTLPTGAPWLSACILAYARGATEAADLYADLARRAGKLLSVAPKLRAKDAEGIVMRLLTEDALLAGPGAFASDRSSRRLFERLIKLGGARELTGRATSRLYGL